MIESKSRLHAGIETASWINIVAGGVVVALPFFTYDLDATAAWTLLVSGAILLLLGAFDAWAAATSRAKSTFLPAGASAIVGAFIAAYTLIVVPASAYSWLNVAAGSIALVAGVASMWASHREKPRPATGERPVA